MFQVAEARSNEIKRPGVTSVGRLIPAEHRFPRGRDVVRSADLGRVRRVVNQVPLELNRPNELRLRKLPLHPRQQVLAADHRSVEIYSTVQLPPELINGS